jgi:hypothetical protein
MRSPVIESGMTHAGSFPIAIFSSFCSKTFNSLSGNLTVRWLPLISLNKSPMEKIELDSAPETFDSRDVCSFSAVISGLLKNGSAGFGCIICARYL